MSHLYRFIKKIGKKPTNSQRRLSIDRREFKNERMSLTYYAKPKEEIVLDNSLRHKILVYLRKKPQILTNKKYIGLLVVVGFFILFGLSTIMSSTGMTIEIEGTRVRDDIVYRDYINSSFTGWKRRNKLTIDTIAIENKLLEKFPEIYDVYLYTPMFSRKMSVVIKIRPIAVAVQNNNEYLLIDTNGVIVSKTELLSEDTQLITLKDDHLLSTKVGDRVYSTDIISFFYTFQQIITQKSKKLEQLRYTDVAHMISVRFTDNNTYDVFFDISLGAVEQFSAYEAVRLELTRQGIVPQKYIDVRLSEKVFYL